METWSIGSPSMMLASLAFTTFLSFSAFSVQSESTTGKPPPPPSKSHHSPPPPPRKQFHGHHQQPPPDEKAAKSKGRNAGKTVGLVFAGIAAILQIGAVGYLTYKRKQLNQMPD